MSEESTPTKFPKAPSNSLSLANPKSSKDVQEELVESVVATPTTFQMRPNLEEMFKSNTIKYIMQGILTKTLADQSYSVEGARTWTKSIADEVNSCVRELKMRRYKHIVQVSLGQQLGSGCRYIARCRWDAECDSYISETFTNATIFCICTVFGVFVY